MEGKEEKENYDGNWRQWSTSPALWEKLRPLVAEKRHEPTRAEQKMWAFLRGRQLMGIKFRRQHTIERFVVDFFCPAKRLVIEIDGPIHHYTPVEDAIRAEFLQSQGYKIIRFTNEAVLSNIDTVLKEITLALQDDATHRLPLSEFGEGDGG